MNTFILVSMYRYGMNKQIAQTILEQIQESRIPNEPYLNFLRVVKASQMVVLEDGVQFRVSGDKFSGKVVIKLNAMDLYDVEFWKVNLSKFEIKKVDEVNDVYNDQLLEVLWNRIVIV